MSKKDKLYYDTLFNDLAIFDKNGQAIWLPYESATESDEVFLSTYSQDHVKTNSFSRQRFIYIGEI